MRRNEALEAAIDECKKLGKSFTYHLTSNGNHVKFFINGYKKVLTISNTRAINNVRCDVRRIIRGN